MPPKKLLANSLDPSAKAVDAPEAKADGGTSSQENHLNPACPFAASKRACPADTCLLAGAIASMGEAIAIWDRDDRLFFCNELYRQKFSDPSQVCRGVSFRELVEQNIRLGNVISFQELEDFPRDFRRYGRERLAYHRRCQGGFEVQIWDGKWSQVRERRTPEGGVVGVYTNITDRKRAEQESDRAKRKEQEANLAKARFLAAASHDLRQPLHALGLFAAALAPLLRSSEQKELMTHMQSCLKSLGSLFSSLLDVSRLDAGVVQPVQTSFFLEEVINPLIEEFRPLACEKALDMRQVPCRAWVKGDRSLLGRVVRNLLSNAVKYTEKGKVLVGCRREGPHLRLEVWDTGPGIAAKDHRRIFEEFNRLPQASTQGVSGLGLGLSIAKRLTELAGWQMGLNSWPGRGSCFFLKLLRAQPENIRPVSAPAPAPVSLRGKRVICLDDDPDVLKSLVAILQRWRCRAYFYRSLADLEGSWQQAEPAPDLVIVDYHLEGDANGVEAIERIGILRGRPLPGLILTGDTTPKCLQAVQASGYPLLYKPVNPMRLRAALEACLS